MIKKHKSTKGITLVALVVTIIILLILAGVAISQLTGSGLFENAKAAEKKQKIAEYMEKFNIAEANVSLQKLGEVDLESFAEEVESQGIIDKDYIEKSEDGSYYTLTAKEGYVFKAILKAKNDVEVLYQETVKSVTNINLSSLMVEKGQSITATVTLEEGADIEKCKWEYCTEAELGTDESKYTNTFSNNKETLELSARTKGEYYLHVLVVDKDGNKKEKVSNTILVYEINGNFKQIIAGGNSYSMALDEEGYLYTWGFNDKGQLGNGSSGTGSENYVLTPTKIGTTKYSQISAGSDHSMALDEEGYLYTWGSDQYGKLGNGSGGSSVLTPTQIGTTKYRQISAGSDHCMALDEDGYLYTWGYNNIGQLGNGSKGTNVSEPTKIGTTKYSQISVGSKHCMALDEEGYLYTWGYNSNGQLGNGRRGTGSEKYVLTPTQIGTTKYSQISACNNYSIALDEEGFLYTWGANGSGQLGNGSSGISNVDDVVKPAKIGTIQYSQISSGNTHSMALDEEGYLYTWGGNAKGQLGNGSSGTNVLTPTQIGTIKYSQISAGDYHSIALDEEGALYTWGYNNNGQLGNGTLEIALEPMKTVINNFIATSAGDNHVMALDREGYLYTWGNNSNGQLGNGSSGGTNVLTPIKIGTTKYSQISAGSAFSMALDKEGYLYTWGHNDDAQVGNGERGINDNADVYTPTKIGTIQYSQISVGSSHCMALSASGYLYTWGYNGRGQLGNGSSGNNAYVLIPTKIGTIQYSQISAGGYNSMALDKNGYLYTWGQNNYGQLGNGTSGTGSENYVLTPTQRGTRQYSQISTAYNHTIALDKEGYLYAWGSNGSKVLTPTQIGTAQYSQISAGYNHNIALDKEGYLYTWGYNADGQLGNGSIASDRIDTPTQIGTRKYSQISAGHYYSMALAEDGYLYTWGNNDYGQLGIEKTNYAPNKITLEK